MLRVLAVLVLAFASLVSCSGDDDRPSITTSGLHEPCPDGGCAAGQECIRAAHPEGTTQTCEIGCEEDLDCPEHLSCNVPPLVPDSIAYICD